MASWKRGDGIGRHFRDKLSVERLPFLFRRQNKIVSGAMTCVYPAPMVSRFHVQSSYPKPEERSLFRYGTSRQVDRRLRCVDGKRLLKISRFFRAGGIGTTSAMCCLALSPNET